MHALKTFRWPTWTRSTRMPTNRKPARQLPPLFRAPIRYPVPEDMRERGVDRATLGISGNLVAWQFARLAPGPAYPGPGGTGYHTGALCRSGHSHPRPLARAWPHGEWSGLAGLGRAGIPLFRPGADRCPRLVGNPGRRDTGFS